MSPENNHFVGYLVGGVIAFLLPVSSIGVAYLLHAGVNWLRDRHSKPIAAVEVHTEQGSVTLHTRN